MCAGFIGSIGGGCIALKFTTRWLPAAQGGGTFKLQIQFKSPFGIFNLRN